MEITTENSLQVLMDGMSSKWQEKRSQSQITLGKLIETLKSLDPNRFIQGIVEPHSYRGYYSDLSFEPTEEKQTVENALKIAKECLGEKFIGYKGGDFYMTKNTPLWIAHYGYTADRLMGLDTTGNVITLITEPEDLGKILKKVLED